MSVSDAWTILETNSSLPSGDAWEHLGAQAGGAAVYVGPVLTALAGLAASAEAGIAASANLILDNLIAEAQMALSANVTIEPLEAVLCPSP